MPGSLELVDRHGCVPVGAHGWRGLLSERQHADDAAAGPVILKLNAARRRCKQRVVFAEPNIESWPESSAALTDKNRASLDEVPVETLDAQALGLAVSAVPGATLTFLMCHDSLM